MWWLLGRSDEYADSDYASDDSGGTASESFVRAESTEKTAIKSARVAVGEMESDSAKYGTRRPYREVITARVIT